LRERADKRLEKLQTEGWNGAQLYGRDPDDGVGGFGAFFLLLDDPEVHGLPPDPVVTKKDLPGMWAACAVADGPCAYDGLVLADAATRGTDIVVIASIVGPLTLLVIVIFVFFRSARRFDESQERDPLRRTSDRATCRRRR